MYYQETSDVKFGATSDLVGRTCERTSLRDKERYEGKHRMNRNSTVSGVTQS